ncbi:hypothetical protein ACFSYH_01890 [Populibacterium corticicola]|uniref:Uncharacterized protein n=1 Tax=Populibacterium corticicola TaxID=1812826 RepID=A0ABW5XBS2_9MICO
MAFSAKSSALTIVAGTGYYTPTAYLEGQFVSLDGAVGMAGTVAIAANAWTPIATLDTDMRPAKYQYYPGNVAGASNQAGSGIRVSTNGVIEVFFINATSSYMPLSGIRFKRA